MESATVHPPFWAVAVILFLFKKSNVGGLYKNRIAPWKLNKNRQVHLYQSEPYDRSAMTICER